MNPKVVIILLIVFGLCLAALLLPIGDLLSGDTGSANGGDSDTSGGQTTETSVLDKQQLGKDLQSISIYKGAFGTVLQLDRINGRWWVTEPSRYPANTGAVDALLATLGSMTGKPIEQSDDLILDGSGLILGYGDTDIALTIDERLGAGRAVVEYHENGVSQRFNSQDTLHDLFDALDPSVFYATSIDVPLLPEVGRIEISMPEGDSALIQRDGRWWIEHKDGLERAVEEPLENQPSLSAYMKLLDGIKLSEPKPVFDEQELASFGLAEPVILLKITPTDPGIGGKGLEVRVGVSAEPKGQARYISVGTPGEANPSVFKAESKDILLLGQPATTFRDPRIATISPSMIQTLRFYPPGELLPSLSVDVAANGSATTTDHKSDNAEADLNAVKVRSLLQALTTATASDYVRQDLDGVDRLMRILMQPRLDGEEESIAIFADPASTPDKPTVLVMRDGEPVLVRVDRKAVAALLDPGALIAETTHP